MPPAEGGLPPALQYHLDELDWQRANAPFGNLQDVAPVRDNSLLLDVGCGAGQTLRLIGSGTAARRIGVDRDADALALGRHCSEPDDVRPVLIQASAHALPFPDGTFSHVLCRVALNYMDQSQAIAEMVRVLRPGGFLLLRLERVYYDAWLVSHPDGVRSLACRLRDLTMGLLHETTGWPPTPGHRRWIGAGRMFASRRRLARRLDRLGCDPIGVEPSAGCARWLGASAQLNLLARRRTPMSRSGG